MASLNEELLRYIILGITNQIMVPAIEIRKIILAADLTNSTKPFTENIRFNPDNGFILLSFGVRAFEDTLIPLPTTNCVKTTAARIGMANIAAPIKNKFIANSALKIRRTSKFSAWSHAKRELQPDKIPSENMPKVKSTIKPITLDPKTNISLDVRISPSSFALSRRFWVGSWFFSWLWSLSAICFTHQQITQ